jgi:hypothetical protein
MSDDVLIWSKKTKQDLQFEGILSTAIRIAVFFNPENFSSPFKLRWHEKLFVFLILEQARGAGMHFHSASAPW